MGLKVSLDTNIFLNVKNKEKPFYNFSKSILEKIDDEEDDEFKAVISIIAITELSVGYHKNNEIKEKNEFISGLYSNKKYRISDLGLNISDKAAELRVKINLKLPDCLIIATALVEGCDALITNDSKFDKIKTPIDIYNSQKFCEIFFEKK